MLFVSAHRANITSFIFPDVSTTTEATDTTCADKFKKIYGVCTKFFSRINKFYNLCFYYSVCSVFHTHNI